MAKLDATQQLEAISPTSLRLSTRLTQKFQSLNLPEISLTRNSIGRLMLLAGLSGSAMGCLEDRLTQSELEAKVAEAQCKKDAGSIKDGKCYIPGGDISEFGDTNFADGYRRRGGDSFDEGTNDTISADEADANDGSTDDGDAIIADADDASDGSTDDGDAIIADAIIADADDASDGSTDDGDAIIADADDADATDEKTDDGDAIIADADDASDGSTDDGDEIIADADDASDGKTDDGDAIIADADDASDGSTDDGDEIIADADDASDGKTDDGDAIIADADDAADLNGDGTADGSSDADSADTTDVQAPKTCDGQPVGTLQAIPTKGPKGETGICKDGARWCSETGAWVTIKASVDPAPQELCNGQDDTCEGNTDEGFKVVQPVSYDPLKIGKGKCVAAVWDCINGKNQEVSTEIGPKPETCNAQDDDCDGFVDNGLPSKSYFTDDPAKIGIGICKEGKKDCNPSTGNYEPTVMEITPVKVGEVCVNKLDDNCDGVTDESKCSCDQDGDGIVTDKFKDTNFLNAVRKALGKDVNADITLADAEKITKLDLTLKGITDISGIECFKNLTYLILDNNGLQDLYPLSVLTQLQMLSFEHNKIVDLSPLADLVNLIEIHFNDNQVSDLSVLKNLINLTILYGNFNQISDITVISGFLNLLEIGFNNNKITDISVLEKLISLNQIRLQSNSIKDITAILKNMGIGVGDDVYLKGNTGIPVSQINSLKAKGANVVW